MKRLAALLFLLLVGLPTFAAAQQFPTVPSGTVIGRTQAGSGPAQAIPFSTLIASMLASSPTIPTINTTTVLFAGSSSGTATIKAQAAAGTPTIQWPNTSGTVADNATAPMVLNPTTGNISCPTCFYMTRAQAAASTSLTGFSAIQTSGYATAGDGGGALFKNVGSTNFLDSFVTGGSISAAGTSYTNGTYKAVPFTGGNGQQLFATVVVSGNAVTSVTRTTNAGGFGFSVGDVLTTSNSNIGGTGSGFTYTITSVSTPVASFTDGSGNHWQYVPQGAIDPRQFGCKFDWAGTDASATDNSSCLQAALNYQSLNQASLSSNGFTTGREKVQLPAGIGMIQSGALTVYGSGWLAGHGPGATTIHVSDSFYSGAVNIITLCDPNAQVACFGARLSDMRIEATATAPANSSQYIVYSNAVQQARAMDNIEMYGGKRGCFRYDTGYGGAAAVDFYDILCTVFSASLSSGMVINGGTTVFNFNGLIVEGTFTGIGFQALGGIITIRGFHSESITQPIDVNLATSNHAFTLMDATGGAGCTNLVTLESTNTSGNFALYNAQKNGCSTNLVSDGQSGGSSRSADAPPYLGWIGFHP